MDAPGSSATPLAPVLDPTLASLAREIAMDIQELSTILRTHGIAPVEWERLQQDPTFQRYFQSAVSEWNSAGSTQERIKVKAAAMVEESLSGLHEACNDVQIPLSQRIDGLRFTANLAGLVAKNGEAMGSRDPGKGFAITINIGSEQVKITQAPEIIEGDAADA